MKEIDTYFNSLRHLKVKCASALQLHVVDEAVGVAGDFVWVQQFIVCFDELVK